jgi:4-diphosphocytidyl-2-C-methyl-D-erythritol kinase
VSGVGERVAPLAGVPSLALLLANPGEPLSTREVFRAYDALHAAHPDPRPGDPAGPPADLRRRLADASTLGALLHNDLEGAALRLCPAVRRLRAGLEERGALAVGMSGSGPTVFGVFESVAAARSAALRPLASPGWLRVATTTESG